MKMQQENENNFIKVLISNNKFLHNLATMKKIASLRRSYEETAER